MIERYPSPAHAGTSYIVRIYRRAPADVPGQRSHDAVELVGIVEDPQAGERSGFHNIEELWAVLSGAAQMPRHDQRGKGG
jgi:mannose-6-phosphate isomerase-like protein (cupin superfamily)